MKPESTTPMTPQHMVLLGEFFRRIDIDASRLIDAMTHAQRHSDVGRQLRIVRGNATHAMELLRSKLCGVSTQPGTQPTTAEPGSKRAAVAINASS